ncbi:hypothetical protein LSPH24S_07612 [Lysinibacillus sphaericus]
MQLYVARHRNGVQSLPFSRLASRVFAAAPISQGGGGHSSGEGGIGGLFDMFNKVTSEIGLRLFFKKAATKEKQC